MLCFFHYICNYLPRVLDNTHCYKFIYFFILISLLFQILMKTRTHEWVDLVKKRVLSDLLEKRNWESMLFLTDFFLSLSLSLSLSSSSCLKFYEYFQERKMHRNDKKLSSWEKYHVQIDRQNICHKLFVFLFPFS